MSFRNNRNRKPRIRGGYNIRRFKRCIPIGSNGNQVMTAYKLFDWGGYGSGFHGGSDGSVEF